MIASIPSSVNLGDTIDPAAAFERIRAGGAEDRAALLADALDLVAAERHGVGFDEPAPAVAQTDEVVPVHRLADQHGAADDRVEAGGIATAREHSDSHAFYLGASAGMRGKRACPTRA